MPTLFKTLTFVVLVCAVTLVHSKPSRSKKDIHEHIPALVERYERMKEDIKLLEETMVKIKEYNVVIEDENTAPSDAEIAADGGAEGNPAEPKAPKLTAFERMRMMAAKWKAEGKHHSLHPILKPAPESEDKPKEDEDLPDELLYPEEEISEPFEISEGNATDGGGEFVAELIEEIPQPEEPDESPVEPNIEWPKKVEQGPSVMQSALQAALARLRARLAAEKAGKDPDKIAGPAPDLLEKVKNNSVGAVNESASTNDSASTGDASAVAAIAPAVAPKAKPTAEQMNAHLSMMDMLRNRMHGKSNPTLDALRRRLKQPHSISESLKQASLPVDHSGVRRVRRKRSLRDGVSKHGVSFLRSRRRVNSASKTAEKSAKRAARRASRRAARRAARRKERESKKQIRKLNRTKEKEAKKQARKALKKNKTRRPKYSISN